MIKQLQQSEGGEVLLLLGGLIISCGIAAFLTIAGLALLYWSGYR